MWVSSFARERDAHATAALATTTAAAAASAASLCVRAHVWGSDKSAAPAEHVSAAQTRVALSPDDALTLAMTADINVLRQLKIVNGSYIHVRARGRNARARMAKLVLVSADSVYTSADSDSSTTVAEPSAAIGDITLAPLLAFNLGIALHAATTEHVTVPVRFDAYSL